MSTMISGRAGEIQGKDNATHRDKNWSLAVEEPIFGYYPCHRIPRGQLYKYNIRKGSKLISLKSDNNFFIRCLKFRSLPVILELKH